MDTNKRYIYTLLTQNSKYYWKFLMSYVILMLFLFGILVFCQVFSTIAIIISIVYIISLWIFTVWITVAFLRKLFIRNELLNWNISQENKITFTRPKTEKDITHRLSEDIVNQFINVWYNEISEDNKFSEESEIFIERTLNLLNKALYSINKKHFTYAVSNIFLKHLKEFRRSLKLKEKNGIKVSDFYRYSFSMLPNKNTCEYYIHQMTKKVLVNFIHWELWNSIPCKLVVSIISSKLSYIIDLCSHPAFLNYYLLKILLSEQQSSELNLFQYTHIKLKSSNNNEDLRREILIEEECTFEETSISKSEVHRDKIETLKNVEMDLGKSVKSEEISENVEIPTVKRREEVKVYEPKSSNEKWNKTLDLTSVSLGEDPLESPSQRKNLTEAIDVLKDGKNDLSPKEGMAHRMNNNKTILEEMKHMTSMEGFKSTMKPFSKCMGDATVSTLRDIKGFQENTVNTVVKPVSHATSQALHKIGDFQDEAAGMVEGLFDLGMAGIRKGLKLTGLQENCTQEGMLSENKIKCSLVSPSASNKKPRPPSNAELAEECVWMNPLQSNIDDDVLGDHDEIDHVPSILMDSSEYGSPDPEYEEAADFATTIAKLRSLLQQKSSSESISTTPVASPMIPENNKSLLDMEDVDGFIPSIYKVCAKTATGVFNNTLNTIKTALPGTDEEIITYGNEKWEFKAMEERGAPLSSRMEKLLQERKDFCMIETAYDAYDSQEPQAKGFLSDVFLDETDDFESKVPLARTFIDIVCELIADSDSLVSQEPFVKFLLLVLGKSIDDVIISKVEDVFNNVYLTEVPKSADRRVLTMDFDVYVDYLISVLPDAVNLLASHSTLKDAISTLILSIQMKKCNKDIILQIFDFIVLRFIDDNSKNNLQS